MSIRYEEDVVEWASEQARLLRAGRFDLIDIEHIADEVEDVGKSEQRELASRLAVLLAHLLKWQYQPERQGKSWRLTIQIQRQDVKYALDETPSLRAKVFDARWWQSVWGKALAQAIGETGMDVFPEVCPWTFDEIMTEDWLPPVN
jgi:hypothetical protein